MQTTYYQVMREEQTAHWVEYTPRPRSKKKALEMAEDLATGGKQVRVDRRVERCDRVKVFNRKPST